MIVALAACQKPEAVVIADGSDGLNRPQDLEFNPDKDGELWVVNRRDDSVTIIFDAYEDSRTSEHLIDPAANHFMEKVSSIAFGARGTFATCQDSRNTYNGATSGNDFTGPTLWSSDLEVFAKSNPQAVEHVSELFGQDADLGSHLDMLHQSPLCVGIAWERDNVYWVNDGLDGALVRYDFSHDHGAGYDDHDDGIIHRYVSGKLKRVAGTVSHMEIDRQAGMIYAVDSGKGRVVTLDMASGTLDEDLFSFEPAVEHRNVRGADMQVFVDGLTRPAGLAMVEDHIVVTDAGTGLIHIYDAAGEEVDIIDTELGDGALAGIEAVSLDEFWYVDAQSNAVYQYTR